MEKQIPHAALEEGSARPQASSRMLCLDIKIDRVEWRRVKGKCSGMKLKFNSMFYLKFSVINIIL